MFRTLLRMAAISIFVAVTMTMVHPQSAYAQFGHSPAGAVNENLSYSPSPSQAFDTTFRMQQHSRVAPVEYEEGYQPDIAMLPPSPTDPAGAPGDTRISELEKKFSALQERLTKKTYPTVRVTGFFQLDMGIFSQDTASIQQFGKVQNDLGFRRARLAAVGDLTENTGYMIEMDFAFPGRPTFMDVFLDLKDVSYLGNVRIGQWRQPFGLDNLNSVRDLTFLERPLSFAFAPFRETGIGFYDRNEAETITWAASVYGYPADAWGNAFGNKGFGTAERITMLLWDEDEGRDLMHVGLDHCFTLPGNSGITYRNTNEYAGPFGNATSQIAPGVAAGGGNAGDLPFFVNSGPLFFTNSNLLNAEFGGVINSFHWQAEATWAVIDIAGNTVVTPSYYARAAYILTGEHLPYNKKTAVFGRVKPANPWSRCGGNGAWEVAAQYSYINMNPVTPFQPAALAAAQPGGPLVPWGGAVNNVSTALNWYINDNAKIQFEYILSEMNRGGIDSTMSTAAIRTQIDF